MDHFEVASRLKQLNAERVLSQASTRDNSILSCLASQSASRAPTCQTSTAWRRHTNHRGRRRTDCASAELTAA